MCTFMDMNMFVLKTLCLLLDNIEFKIMKNDVSVKNGDHSHVVNIW